jgi:hypothetical protein
MKDLTPEELNAAPPVIQYMWSMAFCRQAIGMSIFEEAIANYPEYFPEEVAHRKLHDSIPQHVHEEYLREYREMHSEVYKDLPPSKGIIGWSLDPHGYAEWVKAYDKAALVAKDREKEIFNRHYKQYGLKNFRE